MSTIQIEYPSSGATYHREEYGVYKYDVYPMHSVLAGQVRRSWLDSFPTLKEAEEAYPEAKVTGSCYSPPVLDHLPDDGDY